MTARAAADGCEGKPLRSMRPEAVIAFLQHLGFVTKEELASAHADPSLTPKQVLAVLLQRDIVQQAQIDFVLSSRLTVEYNPDGW